MASFVRTNRRGPECARGRESASIAYPGIRARRLAEQEVADSMLWYVWLVDSPSPPLGDAVTLGSCCLLSSKVAPTL
eukprot:291147-Amphidinium_carterae.1